MGVHFVSAAPLVTTNSAVFQLTRGQSVDDDVNRNFSLVLKCLKITNYYLSQFFKSQENLVIYFLLSQASPTILNEGLSVFISAIVVACLCCLLARHFSC